MASLFRLVPDARAELLQVNSWARPHQAGFAAAQRAARYGAAGPEASAFVAARREAVLTRLGEGAASWNGWAGEMARLRGRIGADGALLALWRLFADVELVDEIFEGDFNVAGIIFPAAARFAGSAFCGDA
jgi:hypothetical protein